MLLKIGLQILKNNGALHIMNRNIECTVTYLLPSMPEGYRHLWIFLTGGSNPDYYGEGLIAK